MSAAEDDKEVSENVPTAEAETKDDDDAVAPTEVEGAGFLPLAGAVDATSSETAGLLTSLPSERMHKSVSFERTDEEYKSEDNNSTEIRKTELEFLRSLMQSGITASKLNYLTNAHQSFNLDDLSKSEASIDETVLNVKKGGHKDHYSEKELSLAVDFDGTNSEGYFKRLESQIHHEHTGKLSNDTFSFLISAHIWSLPFWTAATVA